VLAMIGELNPCRLSFVTIFFTVTQFAFTAMLAVDVFLFDNNRRKNG
jgi:hypothetical protein